MWTVAKRWKKNPIHKAPKSKSSFSNAQTSGNYRSKFEAEIANQLPAAIREEYETEKIEYDQPRKYTPDFPITFADTGKRGFIEVKGRWTSGDRTKMKLIKKQYPHLDIRMVFQQNRLLRPGSLTRYTDWCEKNGIKCAVGHVPERWFKK
jgi:hypothetical protein